MSFQFFHLDHNMEGKNDVFLISKINRGLQMTYSRMNLLAANIKCVELLSFLILIVRFYEAFSSLWSLFSCVESFLLIWSFGLKFLRVRWLFRVAFLRIGTENWRLCRGSIDISIKVLKDFFDCTSWIFKDIKLRIGRRFWWLIYDYP